MARAMSVLLEFGEYKRAVNATSDGNLEDFLQVELQKIDPNVKLVMDLQKYKKKEECEKPVFLHDIHWSGRNLWI
jgi:hypothetical protein